MTFSNPGGDTIQMMKTKEWLEEFGNTVDICLERSPNVEPYDVVHVFNMQDCAVTHSFYQVLNAKRQEKPVALSTIYWNFSEIGVWSKKIDQEELRWHRKLSFDKVLNSILRKNFGIEVRKLSGLEWMVWKAKQEESQELIKYQQLACLMLANVLLPNAEAELNILKKDFDIPLENALIVPNGADLSFEGGNGMEFKSHHKLEEYVLCVGRIEHSKNQLLLIRAMKGSGIPLVLIGRSENKEYMSRCLNEDDGNVLFVDAMPHAKLKSAYAGAKVHALPSWRETPGLVNLEAGLAGCNLVITNRGSTEEYFGNMAFYCEPGDIMSIRKAVLKAFKAPRDGRLKNHIKENYTWEKAAEKTIDAYNQVVGRR
jgi:glycosyltransferase involved in cell wall biosynthesis